ncbi:hypothetical protein [Salininema proteolyticum]|uniref:Uncharacterized protein n=1 Tax=Salininema proteolyticum TaxID=1607685 RepID=A0ABV8TWX7_9ACTN
MTDTHTTGTTCHGCTCAGYAQTIGHLVALAGELRAQRDVARAVAAAMEAQLAEIEDRFKAERRAKERDAGQPTWAGGAWAQAVVSHIIVLQITDPERLDCDERS